MKLEKIKVDKKYRISFKDDDKSSTINAIITSNNFKKKILKFKTKEDIYECKYSEITKIQSLTSFRLKLVLWCLVILLSLLLYYYRTLLFHVCAPVFWPDGQKQCDTIWKCENGKCGCTCIPESVELKPIIYLYPEKKTDVTVALGCPENTTHTYPKYNEPWKVHAEPNGDLIDLKTGRHYYALYWEGKNTVSVPNPKEGFVVAGKDTISFLEEKLERLGLTEREAEEFIVYWLPKLESAKYNLIRFQTLAEQNKNMPLDITPAPQTLIRVMMEYKNLDKPIQVKEQVLPPKPQRKGFTVVEWGGTEI